MLPLVVAQLACAFPAAAANLPFKLMGIEVGSAVTLDDVSARLGIAPRLRGGDDGTGELHQCYRIKQGANTVFLEFASSMEMAVPAGQVTSIRVAYKRPGDNVCSRLAHSPGRLSAENGLALGLPRAKVLALLGQRTSQANDMLEYQTCQRAAVPGNIDDCAYVEVTLRNDRVVSFSLNRVQSAD